MKFKLLFILLILIQLLAKAQDKLFLKNGQTKLCNIVNINDSTLFFIDTTAIGNKKFKLQTKDILIAEKQTGEIYIFGESKNYYKSTSILSETESETNDRILNEWRKKSDTLGNTILGFYPTQLIVGRLTFSYERLILNKSIGINIPFSLTFNPYKNAVSNNRNNRNQNYQPSDDLGFVTGIDINYYHPIRPELDYFVGPRYRTGKDIFLGGIEGQTFMLQNGLLKSRGKHFTNMVAIGFGFFKLSDKYAKLPGYSDKQVYPWMSFTWRVGLRL